MKISVDTNVLLRLVVDQDATQRPLAVETLRSAELVAVSMSALCEVVWVMKSRYKIAKPDVAEAIRLIADIPNVALDRPALDAGLKMLDAGGDFADGVIAYDGQWLGGETFVSFDKQAVKLLQGAGSEAALLA